MTGQRSNQLNYAPAPRDEALLEKPRRADKMHTKSATLASVVKFARVQQGCGFVAHDGVRNRRTSLAMFIRNGLEDRCHSCGICRTVFETVVC